MGGKHLKRVRAEKAKVQLKKKKLPKGQNVTDTSFKVKKILTVEQLRKVDADEPVSNWNVPLKDLLIRLNHYNFTTRLNALNGIKELLTNYPEILQGPSLKSIISKLLDLLTDEEYKIRMATMELMTYLFSAIPPSALFPFHDLIKVHLGCAMTHRNSSVQQDSIKFIDVMVKYTPEALRNNFWSLTQNFIRIIKRIITEPQGVSSKESQQNLEKLKTEIFSRFYLFMTSGLSSATMTNQTVCQNIDMTSLAGQNISLRQSNNQYKQIPDLSSLFMSSKNKNSTLKENSNEEFKEFSNLVVPLLFETWIEFCPEQKFKRETTECVLTDGIAALLCVLLKILMFLYERSLTMGAQMEKWFTSTFSQNFKKCFTTDFPYSQSTSRKRSSTGKPSELVNSGCVLQNLIICFLSFSFRLVGRSRDSGSKIENYLIWALTKKTPIEIEILSKTVKAVISKTENEHKNNILKKIVNAYDKTQSVELQQEITKALARMISDENEGDWQNEESFLNWMRSLPEHMCQSPVLKEVIETILMLVNRPAGAEIIKKVESTAVDIIRNIHNLKVEGMSEHEGHKMIVNILYRCSRSVLQEILYKEVLTNNHSSQKLQDYIKNTFYYKLFTQSEFC